MTPEQAASAMVAAVAAGERRRGAKRQPLLRPPNPNTATRLRRLQPLRCGLPPLLLMHLTPAIPQATETASQRLPWLS